MMQQNPPMPQALIVRVVRDFGLPTEVSLELVGIPVNVIGSATEVINMLQEVELHGVTHEGKEVRFHMHELTIKL